MAETGPISLDALNGFGRERFLAALANVYEHAPWAAERAWTQRPFASVRSLFAGLRDGVHGAAADEQMALLRGHPELAVKPADRGALTAESASEQGGAGLDRLPDHEFATFRRLNDAYRARFAHPFIICVRRHTRDSILEHFERRLGHSPESERDACFGEIDRIAALRLGALVTGPGPLETAGRLSTHVLDLQRGLPAAGVTIELRELRQAGDHRLLWKGETNADGRTDAALIEGVPVPAGRYEIAFGVGGYFARTATGLADPPFLDIVPVRFAVAEPERGYHVPLLVTPWSYSCYRGS
jgi:2-oxo-4-hydroxy-4-carboxy-5-ureidoimidazoline decarboxylase